MSVLHQTERKQQCIVLVSVRVLKQLKPFQAHFTPTDWQLSPLNCCISPEGPLTLKKQAQTGAALCRVPDRASWVWHFTKINKLSIAILSIGNLKAAKLKAPVRWHLLLSDIFAMFTFSHGSRLLCHFCWILFDLVVQVKNMALLSMTKGPLWQIHGNIWDERENKYFSAFAFLRKSFPQKTLEVRGGGCIHSQILCVPS